MLYASGVQLKPKTFGVYMRALPSPLKLHVAFLPGGRRQQGSNYVQRGLILCPLELTQFPCIKAHQGG